MEAALASRSDARRPLRRYLGRMLFLTAVTPLTPRATRTAWFIALASIAARRTVVVSLDEAAIVVPSMKKLRTLVHGQPARGRMKYVPAVRPCL